VISIPKAFPKHSLYAFHLSIPDPEDEGVIIFRNVGNSSSTKTES